MSLVVASNRESIISLFSLLSLETSKAPIKETLSFFPLFSKNLLYASSTLI